MATVIRRLLTSALALLAAITVFLATYRFGFPVAAALALLTFAGITLVLLRSRAGASGVATWGWTLGSSLVYLVAAQMLVGRAAPRMDVVPTPPPEGLERWTLPDGLRIAYRKTASTGDTARAPVVFVHGGPGTPALAFHQALGVRPLDFLAASGHDVYYYDQIGSGLSDRLDLKGGARYTLEGQVAQLEAIRSAIGAPRVVLVGEGFGAVIAANYMLQHPDQVERVVLASPAPLWAPAWKETIAATARASLTDVQASALAALERPTLRLTLGRMMADFSASAAHTFIPEWEADDWWTRMTLESWRLGRPRMTCRSEPWSGMPDLTGLGFFANSYLLADALRQDDLRPQLQKVTTDALILRGTCDAFDWEISHEYLTTLPSARYVAVPTAGHFIWLEQATMWRELISGLMRGEKLPLEVYDTSRAPRGS